jgi:transposase-like protein
MILPCEQRRFHEAMMAVSVKGVHCPKEVILMGAPGMLAYPLSTRHVEALMAERGVEVDHSTMNRGASTTARRRKEDLTFRTP